MRIISQNIVRSKSRKILKRALISILCAGVCFELGRIHLAFACDLHGAHDGEHGAVIGEGVWQAGVSEQFSYYGRIQQSGHYVSNEAQQHLASSITQMNIGYGISDQVSIFTHLPYISQRYRRLEDGNAERGTVSGIGDMQIMAVYAPVMQRGDDSSFSVQIFGGLKLPTGDSDELGEQHHHGEGAMNELELEHSDDEIHESHDDDMHDEGAHHSAAASLQRGGREIARHGGESHDDSEFPGVPSAIHGHDLALGSGSFDVPVGVNVYVRDGIGFFRADVMYMIRTEGDHQYQYANDLTWRTGPGVFLLNSESERLSFSANFSGEYKREDQIGGVDEEGSSMRAAFLGPRLAYASGDLLADFGVDLPIDIQNSGYQAVAQYRLRGALSYRF